MILINFVPRLASNPQKLPEEAFRAVAKKIKLICNIQPVKNLAPAISYFFFGRPSWDPD